MKPLHDVLVAELAERGWRQDAGPHGRRLVCGFRHRDGEFAVSLNDAILRQLIRDHHTNGHHAQKETIDA